MADRTVALRIGLGLICALATPGQAFSNDLVPPLPVLTQLQELTAEQIDEGEKVIVVAEERMVAKLTGKKILGNRGPRTEEFFRDIAHRYRKDLRSLRREIDRDLFAWKRRAPQDPFTLQHVYNRPRRAIELAWQLLIIEFGMRVNALDLENKKLHGDLHREWAEKARGFFNQP